MEPETFAAIGIVLIFIALVLLREKIERVHERKNNASLNTCSYATATIARNLTPKLNTLMASDPSFVAPTFYIIGGDGYPLWTDDSYPWRGALSELLKKGATIHYLLTDATSTTIQKLVKLQAQLQNQRKGKIEFYFLNSVLADEPDRKVIETFRTFHPMLIEGSDKRALWIEGYHPARSTVAFRCKYVSPDDAKIDPRYDRYRQAILRLIQNYRANAHTVAA